MTAILEKDNAKLDTRLGGFLRLTRWREHVPFTIPLTLVGAMMASHLNQVPVDWRLGAIISANILAISFAFMINDVEDAPDDAREPRKKAHNVISSEVLSRREGYILSLIVAALAFGLYSVSGWWALTWGTLTLLLSYLYSAYPFRLKARPVVDILSHALMLSGLLVMTGYYAYNPYPDVAWYVIGAAILFSAYGQFYNQIEDYQLDKAAGLRNTVVLLGETRTRILMYLSLVGAAFGMVMAIYLGAFPGDLTPVLVVGGIVCALFTWDTDMRGTATSGSGALQKPALMIANLVTLLWLVWSLGYFSAGISA